MFSLLPLLLNPSPPSTHLLLNPNPNPNPNLIYTQNSFPSIRTSPPFLHYSIAASKSPIAGKHITDSIPLRIRRLSEEFRSLPEPIDRVKRLLFYAADLPPLSDADRIPSNRVSGCTAQVWISAKIDPAGRIRFSADSDSEITRGFCACLLAAVDGADPEDVLAIRADDLAEVNVIGVLGRTTQSRVNTWRNVLIGMQKRVCKIMVDGERLDTCRDFAVSGRYD